MRASLAKFPSGWFLRDLDKVVLQRGHLCNWCDPSIEEYWLLEFVWQSWVVENGVEFSQLCSISLLTAIKVENEVEAREGGRLGACWLCRGWFAWEVTWQCCARNSAFQWFQSWKHEVNRAAWSHYTIGRVRRLQLRSYAVWPDNETARLNRIWIDETIVF